jgi:toxin ParE1/3/4
MRIKWLRAALQELDHEAEYIALDSPVAAARMIETIVRSINQLTKYPAMGRPGRVSGTRELVVPNTHYIIPYRVRGDWVEILRVFHAARKWPKNFDEKE